MANLSMAIPVMQAGAPQASAGNAIVQEETFIQFSQTLFSYFGTLRNKRMKIMDIKGRIDLDNERRLRRLGEPEKVLEGDAIEEKGESSGMLSGIFGFIKKLIATLLSFIKKLIPFIGPILLKMTKLLRPLMKGILTGLRVLKFALPRVLPFLALAGLAYYAKDIYNAFMGKDVGPVDAPPPEPTSTEEGTGIPDYVGDGDDTEMPVPITEEGTGIPDDVGDGDDTEKPVVKTPERATVEPKPQPKVDDKEVELAEVKPEKPGVPERKREESVTQQREGFRAFAYDDRTGKRLDSATSETQGFATIGYGHKLTEAEKSSGMITLSGGEKIDISRGISREQAQAIYKDDFGKITSQGFANLQKQGVDTANLSRGTRAALSDLFFNAGAYSVSDKRTPKLMTALRANNTQAIAAELTTTARTSGGIRMPGLEKRAQMRSEMVAGKRPKQVASVLSELPQPPPPAMLASQQTEVIIAAV